MRLRQHSRYLTTVAGCALAAAVLAGCDGGSSDAKEASSPTVTASTRTPTPTPTPAPTPTPTPTPTSTPTPAPTPAESSTPSASPSSPPAEPELIPYAGGESVGVVVHGMADAKKLRGAPAAFQEFIGRTAERVSDKSNCDGAVGVTVEFLRTDGYAVGGVNDCGGYAALWAVVDGAWRQIQGTQDSWSCRVLHQFTVPSDIAGETCYDYQAQKEHPYHQA